MIKKIFLIALLIFSVLAVKAQILTPVKWKVSSEVTNKGAALVFEANIDEGWHLYDTKIPEGGPIATSFNFEKLDGVKLVGGIMKSNKATTVFDKNFQLDLSYFSNKVVFKQYVKFTNDKPLVEGYIEFMACNDETCTAPTDEEFMFDFKNSKK